MAIQLHGAIGTTNEYDIGLYFKRAMTLASRWGNAAAHRRRYAQLSLQSVPRIHSVPQRTFEAFPVDADWDAMPEVEFRQMVRALFAKHYKTDKPIPDPLHAKMVRARGFGRALATQRQLFLAALDQAYHTRRTPMDTTAMLAEIQSRYTPFKHVEGTHFQGTFGHLVGYDAGYYGYQWALSIAKDLLTRFDAAGLLDEKTARDYRGAILSRGGSEEPAELVRAFLGRAPSDEAYKRFLVGAPSGPAKATPRAKKGQ